MSAVLEVSESNVSYLDQLQPPLIQHFEQLATAPGGVVRLRELILTLAVQGKLVPQDPKDEPASVLLKKIRAEKDRLIAEGKIKRDKPLAEIAEDEKPFELPCGWEWVHLTALAEQITKGTTPTTFGHSYASEGVNFVKIENIDRGRLNLAQMTDFIAPETHEIMSRSQLSAGDVLFSIAGTIGKTAVVLEEDLPANTNQALAIIKGAAKHVNQRFLLLALDSFVSNKVKGKARGGAMNNISLGDLSVLLMTIPPLAEQSRIVVRVEELMRVCDALDAKGKIEAAQHAQLVSTLLGTLTGSDTPEALAANWQRVASHFDLLLDRPQAVDAFEQTILQLAVRGLLVPQDPKDEPASVLLQKIRAEKDRLILQGKIKRDKPLAAIADEEKPFAVPMGWEWAPLQHLGYTQTGTTPDKKNPELFGTWIPFIKPGDISSNFVDYDNEGLSERGLQDSGRLAPAGSILMVCIGTIGKSNLIARNCSFNQQINSLTPLCCRPEYVSLFMRNPSFQAEAWGRSSSTTIAILNKGKWEGIAIALPPLAEQSRIVTRVEALRRLCADLRQRLSASQTTQARLAEALVEKIAA